VILILGMLMQGALFGLLVVLVMRTDFPGWGLAIGGALLVGVATMLARALLPEWLGALSIAAGAAAGALLLRRLCSASWREAGLVVGLYLAVGFVVDLGLDWISG
jgi:hypothetical protein